MTVVFYGSYVDGIDGDLAQWCGLELSDASHDELWGGLNITDLVMMTSSGEIIATGDFDADRPGASDTFYEVHSSDIEAFRKDLRSAIQEFLAQAQGLEEGQELCPICLSAVCPEIEETCSHWLCMIWDGEPIWFGPDFEKYWVNAESIVSTINELYEDSSGYADAKETVISELKKSGASKMVQDLALMGPEIDMGYFLDLLDIVPGNIAVGGAILTQGSGYSAYMNKEGFQLLSELTLVLRQASCAFERQIRRQRSEVVDT